MRINPVAVSCHDLEVKPDQPVNIVGDLEQCASRGGTS